jgi:hypothetical protein
MFSVRGVRANVRTPFSFHFPAGWLSDGEISAILGETHGECLSRFSRLKQERIQS